jgi:hypothetical protein
VLFAKNVAPLAPRDTRVGFVTIVVAIGGILAAAILAVGAVLRSREKGSMRLKMLDVRRAKGQAVFPPPGPGSAVLGDEVKPPPGA